MPTTISGPQTLFIDADDTLWENNVYFEQAIAEFIERLMTEAGRAHRADPHRLGNAAVFATKAEWRKAREAAYDAGEYVTNVPDVTTGQWDKVAWCNFVRFNRPELNGFDDRTTP